MSGIGEALAWAIGCQAQFASNGPGRLRKGGTCIAAGRARNGWQARVRSIPVTRYRLVDEVSDSPTPVGVDEHIESPG
jgi:hypothetical protein